MIYIYLPPLNKKYMFGQLKIGYVPYSSDLSHPDDRRRFPYFAQRKQVSYELADDKKSYDIVILPASANLSKWLLYKKRNPQTKFVFEMVDNMIYQVDWYHIVCKGIGRYVTGRESSLWLTHRNLLVRWLKIADVVICSNPKIKNEVQEWNSQVILDLDYLEHEYKYLKTDYSITGKMKLFWEGQGMVLPQLLAFKKMFRQINPFCELHIVTAASYPLPGQFLKRHTRTILKKLPIETHFHQWDMQKNPTLFSQMDCGIIPLNKGDVYGWHKPANKLISFWFSGIPTLASNTPAYTNVAEKTKNNFICATDKEWIEKLHRIKEMTASEREQEAKTKYGFAQKLFSNETHDHFWINLFEELQTHFTKDKIPGLQT